MIINMKQATQIRKAFEGGESIADLAIRFKITEARASSLCEKKKRKSRAKQKTELPEINSMSNSPEVA